MNKVLKSTLKKAYKPMDIVTDRENNTGIIQEVSVNHCQEGFNNQINYAVNWIVGDGDKYAWYSHKELTSHGNILIKIAEMSCHPMGNNKQSVEKLFKHF